MVRPARCRLADHGGWGRGHTFSPRERCPLLGRVGQTWAGAGRNPCGASQSDPGRERFEHVATERSLPRGIREGVREGLEMKVLEAGRGSLKQASVGKVERSSSTNSSRQSH